MKLIIDIPDIDLNNVKNGSIMSANILNACKNGIPLDDVKAEIDKMIDNTYSIYGTSALRSVLEILDNIGKAERKE